jgi:hypothetical protein
MARLTLNKEPVSVDTEDVRSYNVGTSDYASRKIQPWSIWEEYKLNPWEADIVKRILRKKKSVGKNMTESRIEDLEKIIHVAKELIRQLKQKV